MPGYVIWGCGLFVFLLLSLCFTAFEILHGPFQSVGLVLSYPLSFLHHSLHAQCRRLFTLAGRGDGGLEFLDWTSPVSAEVLSTFDFFLLLFLLFCAFFFSLESTELHFLLLQVWGCRHLCCNALGNHEDAVPCCNAILFPDDSIQFGLLCSHAQPGIGMPERVLGWSCHFCCVHKSCSSHSEGVSNRATLSDANICDDGRRTELSEQHPGPLPEGWATFQLPDLLGFSVLYCGHANSAGESDGECLPEGSVFTVCPVSLLTLGCSIDWFSSWGHRWSPKKCLSEANSHAGLWSNSWLCCKWLENCKTQTSISDFRLNSTLLLKKGFLTGSSNRWTETPSLSTPTASALRWVRPLKFQVYSGLKTVFSFLLFSCLFCSITSTN